MTDPIEDLVLARLLCARRPAGRAKLRATLEPLVRHRWSAAEWRDTLTKALERLAASGAIEVSSRGGVQLTRSGRERALAFVGLPPSRVPAHWRAVRSALAARAIGAPGAALTSETLRCAIVARAHGLELKGKPTESSVRNALTWKALGVTSERPVTRAAVQATLLGRLVGEDGGLDPRRALPVLAARAVGARRSGADDLQAAAIRTLLDARPDSGPGVAEPPDAALAAFAQRILAIARDTPADGRFGTNKVFISHIWRALESAGERDRAAFAHRLIEANRLGHLRLSRADLVEAMDREQLAASEIAHENATFHFVRL